MDMDACKVREQMYCGSFRTLKHDISIETCSKILEWTKKWISQSLSDEWIEFITNFDMPHPGINYPLIKTHKTHNPARVITSGCGTLTENFSLFVEKYYKVVVDSISSRVRDTAHMLDIIDELNLMGVRGGDLLVSFASLTCFHLSATRQGWSGLNVNLMSMSVSVIYRWNVLWRHWKFA